MEKSNNNTEKQVDYNDEPVFYCEHCLSLNIKEIEGIDYCSNCGGTVIGQTHINDWTEKYKSRYGEEYINNKE